MPRSFLTGLTLATALGIASGGTGATTPAGALLGLGAASSDDASALAIQLAKVRGPLFPGSGLVDGFLNASGYDTTNSVNANLSSGTILNQATDANTKCILHFDGANGSTTITDAVSGHAWSVVNGAALSTAQFVFGTASLKLTTAGDYISASASTDFGPGSGDFTYNIRVRLASVANSQCLIEGRTAQQLGINVSLNSNGKIQVGNNSSTLISGSTALSANTWTDIEVTRASGTLRLFINGTLDGSATDNTTYATSASLVIGAFYDGSGGAVGYFEEFRFRNAAAHNTNASFNPATSAFALGTSGLLDLRTIAIPLLAVPTRGVMRVRVKQTAGTLNFGSGGNLTGMISRTGSATAGSALTFTQVNNPLAADGSFVFLRSAPVDLTGQSSAASLVGRLQTNDNALGVQIDGWDVRAA